MISRTGKNNSSACASARNAGFTLIELIVVMALLATVLALVSPSLARFFRGRDIEEEAKRFLALTRFARNEAISQSIPMTLWMNTDTRQYGLRPAPGYTNPEFKPLEYDLAKNLQFYFENPVKNENKETTITFLPDGSVGEPSQGAVEIRSERDPDEQILIARSRNGLEYRVWNKDDYASLNNSYRR